MKLKKVEQTVQEILENNLKARNDNFVLVYEVYQKLDIPVKFEFMGLMLEHSKYGLPSFESITRARRKIVKNHPELQSSKKIKEFRKVQEEEYFEYALN